MMMTYVQICAHMCNKVCIQAWAKKCICKASFQLVLCCSGGRWAGISTQKQTASARILRFSQGRKKKLAYCRTLSSSKQHSKQTLESLDPNFISSPWCIGCGSLLWQAHLPVSDSSPRSISASSGPRRRPCMRWQPPPRRLLLRQPPCPAACLARSSGSRTRGRCPCHSPWPPRRTWGRGGGGDVSQQRIQLCAFISRSHCQDLLHTAMRSHSHSHTCKQFVLMHSVSQIKAYIWVGISCLYPPLYHS